jgi:hypothetical protein
MHMHMLLNPSFQAKRTASDSQKQAQHVPI